MGYIRAEKILPQEIIEMIQQYVDGENIYIPKKTNSRTAWGTKTTARQSLNERNQNIYKDYCLGLKVGALAQKYFLSEKSIQRIIRSMKLKT
ncbi:MAG: CD3324 family protein [Acutalibacteraceae bacterium]